MNCYLSFSPTTWEIMGSRASSQANASGNRLRRALHSHPLYLLSALQGDNLPFHFPDHFFTTSNLCVFCHSFCSSQTVFLKEEEGGMQSTVSNFARQLQSGPSFVQQLQCSCGCCKRHWVLFLKY